MKQEQTTALESHNVLFILLGLAFMCVQLCATVAIVAYYHKSVLSKLKVSDKEGTTLVGSIGMRHGVHL